MIHFLREFVKEGGLMSYGNSLADAYRQVATQTAKILNGAKLLCLSFPLSLLGRADEVIE